MGKAERMRAPATWATSAFVRTLPSRPTAMLPAPVMQSLLAAHTGEEDQPSWEPTTDKKLC